MHHRSHDWGSLHPGGGWADTPLQVVRILLEFILVNRLILVGTSHTEGKVLVNSQTFPVFLTFFPGHETTNHAFSTSNEVKI